MDRELFRDTYRELNEHFCPYEKGILTRQCQCALALRFCVAERVGVRCAAQPAQARCLATLEFLRHRARFALGVSDGRAGLPHGQSMRLQVGGLRGLHAALAPEAPIPTLIEDVHATLEAVWGRFEGLAGLPLAPIIQQIAAYPGRLPSRP